ncbi:hypothetical protein BD626DRAFT_489274 [Schizophyllum amplum]|uniref:Uncharacterized protein n=1 Tax=Schizophyllum amplum TaxID=97359 RepID=A0A550CLF9_9AGAR|nr:hypothetical protein BD626DRAFT_489274 [Auriculariopsis ampla]
MRLNAHSEDGRTALWCNGSSTREHRTALPTLRGQRRGSSAVRAQMPRSGRDLPPSDSSELPKAIPTATTAVPCALPRLPSSPPSPEYERTGRVQDLERFHWLLARLAMRLPPWSLEL